MDKREKIIKIRASEAEYSALLLRCPKARLAEWMREHCLDTKVAKIRQIPNVDPMLLRQLAGLGNNLNQIARTVNTQEWKTLDKISILAALSSIERELKLIRLEHSNNDC